MNQGNELESLRRIFLLLVISLSVLLATALIYIIRDTRSDRIRDLQYTSSVINGYFELGFQQWELSLLSVGNRLIEIEDDQQRLDYANKAVGIYERELLAFGFAKPDGQVITFTGRPLNDTLPNLMASDLTRRSFEIALSRDHISLGESYYFQNVEDWILPIRVPIKDENGAIVAVNTSAVNYRTITSELNQFGINENYQIHLVNNDFNTTQLVFPLDTALYSGILGNDSLVYEDQVIMEVHGEQKIMESKSPFTGEELLCVVSELKPVNHTLMVSVPKSTLFSEITDRFKFVLLTYALIIFGSRLLYHYLRRNLKESLSNVQTERANLKAIIESTDDYIALFNKELHLVEYNRAFEISAKMTDDLDLYKGIDILSEIKSQEHAEVFKGYIKKAFEGEKFSEEVVYPSPDGELVFRFTYNPIYQNGEVIRISLFAENITEIRNYQRELVEYSKNLEGKVKTRTKELRTKNKELANGYEVLKSTQQQLIRAEKMASLGVLSAGIGHEINNPLNFIKHGSEALQMKLKELLKGDTSELEVYFKAIDEGVTRAADIVDGLSHFSRTGTNLDEDCDVHQIIHNSLTLLSNQFKTGSITVEQELKATNISVKGNDGKLHQVVTNILSNAEHAIEGPGKIMIRTWNDGDKVVMEFEDTGSGMSEEVLNKMTDPFFTTKDPGVGTGLGMFISQMIIDEHHAEMEVESTVGKGTTFRIILNAN